ncbi:MAG: PaaI family thioesterase [Mycobacteriaceae bacterium]|nr:PaaI family thioesterase [Mycobacteriaceae bacterium]
MHITDEMIYRFAPFAETLGITFPELKAHRVQAYLPVKNEFTTLGGGLHGGAIMSICDVASAVCVALNIDDGKVWSTAESNSYFLRPVRHAATATATPIKLGKALTTVKTEVHDHTGTLCAYTTQIIYLTQATGTHSLRP